MRILVVLLRRRPVLLVWLAAALVAAVALAHAFEFEVAVAIMCATTFWGSLVGAIYLPGDRGQRPDPERPLGSPPRHRR